MWTRRQFLWGVTTAGVAYPVLARGQAAGSRLFRHGVASGDPQPAGVILWTRITPPAGTRSADVRWEVASDQGMAQVVASGTVITAPDRDFTVKVDARGLEPGRTYFYAFRSGGERSPIGRTRTLPSAVDRLRLASVSCANYPAGFFNVYRILAERDDLDAIVHLGDYIYEFADGIYGDGKRLDRVPQPPQESVTLQGYRQRYATYRLDPDLQAAHQQHPFIAIWDDHEVANDTWRGGAQNHNPELGEGNWAVRRAAAWRAYMEWMPIREQPDADIKLYRTFRFGSLAELVMLDTRSLRDRQVASDDLAGLADPSRRVLGAAQESWFYDTMRASARDGITWRLIGQQVLFSPIVPPGRAVMFTDVWDAYRAERGRIIDFLEGERARNVAILTGDLHSSWAFDVPRNPWGGYRPQSGSGSLAVELVCPAISSPGLMTPEQSQTLAPALQVAVPSIKYLDGQRQGYVLLDVTPGQMRADWYHADTVQARSTGEQLAASFICESGSAHLAPA
jgi:alkaline phosphatase D